MKYTPAKINIIPIKKIHTSNFFIFNKYKLPKNVTKTLKLNIKCITDGLSICFIAKYMKYLDINIVIIINDSSSYVFSYTDISFNENMWTPAVNEASMAYMNPIIYIIYTLIFYIMYMYDTVIIGGGISGLYTYMRLIDEQIKNKSRENILLLEQNNYFGGRILQMEQEISGVKFSFPAGAARFNKNHTRVIGLLKRFGLIDFRKERGSVSRIEFMDSENQFKGVFDNKHGFMYIDKVIKHGQDKDKDDLQGISFKEFAATCLTAKELEYMLTACGYSGQLKHMNAFDAINLFTNGIRTDMKYWGGKFHLLIAKIVEYLHTHGANLHLRCAVTNIDRDEKGLYTIKFKNRTVLTKKVILCIPQPALLKLNVLHPIHNLLRDTISCKSLCRTYAIFDKKDIWFKDIDTKIVTNNQLRYIIPMDAEQGLIMISYTDDIYTKYWKSIQNNQTKLKQSVVKLVHDTFDRKIKNPIKVIVCHWECGVGYWNKGVDSKIMSTFILNPFSNLYICGENYSTNQSWVEGALETCDKCFCKLTF